MINPPKPKEGPKPTKKDLEIMLQVSFPVKGNPNQYGVWNGGESAFFHIN